MQIYLDESGDLGWKFDQPFRAGGSSQYLTLSFLVLPSGHIKRPKKIIRDLYRKYDWQSEKKAADATPNQKRIFCDLAKKVLGQYPDIKVDIITVRKSNVQSHIRQDANKLYNYMVGLVVPEYVAGEANFDLIPDERSIKVKSQNSLKDYLQIKLWFDLKYKTVVNCYPAVSSGNYNLQFADWIAHCIWAKYENSENSFFDILRPVVRIRELFFLIEKADQKIAESPAPYAS